MRPVGTPLEQARGRVREAEERVAVQREVLRELTRTGLETHDAEELLLIFERSLQVMREHLRNRNATNEPITHRSLDRGE